jgi:hypothetical protein
LTIARRISIVTVIHLTIKFVAPTVVLIFILKVEVRAVSVTILNVVFDFHVFLHGLTYAPAGVYNAIFDATSRVRTCDNPVNSRELYQLRYGDSFCFSGTGLSIVSTLYKRSPQSASMVVARRASSNMPKVEWRCQNDPLVPDGWAEHK